MKKTIIVLLTVFYFAVASGVVVSLHYCGGKLKEISLFHSASEDGCCGTKDKSKGCCSEKNTFIKIKDDYNLSDNTSVFNYLKEISASCSFLETLNIALQYTSNFSLKFHPPLVLYHNLLYLKFKVLLI